MIKFYHIVPYFKILNQDSNTLARTGILHTDHGTVRTPAFFFCATQGTLKGVAVDPLLDVGTQLLLSNTYHLMLQPGSELIEKMGGIHQFMAWPQPVFTDSGGYQIFSLWHGSVSDEIKGQRRFKSTPPRVRVSEEGALFVSHRDGQRHLLSPERSIQVQSQLGADFICVLDECTPVHMTKQQTKDSLDLSHRWALRSLEAFEKYGKPHQGLYGIIQGGIHPDLRQESIEFIQNLPFFGHAVGGSLGCTKEQMYQVVDMALAGLPRHKPIHLLGIGGIQDIFEGVGRGIDTFDCVAPTRLGRHGGAIVAAHHWKGSLDTPKSHISLWKSCFRDDPRPIDEACPCSTCGRYSRAYIHHLLKAKEILALTALTLHNVCAMNRLMEDIRKGIENCDLDTPRRYWLGDL
jgi:queuine tRNA-ribosyltransferase